MMPNHQYINYYALGFFHFTYLFFSSLMLPHSKYKMGNYFHLPLLY